MLYNIIQTKKTLEPLVSVACLSKFTVILLNFRPQVRHLQQNQMKIFRSEIYFINKSNDSLYARIFSAKADTSFSRY